MLPESFRCFLVRKPGKDRIESGVEQRPLRELPAGDVLIRVAFSSLNYKDAMAATGHPGVARKFPHVPGIDAAGTVVESTSTRFKPGDAVIATGHDIGVERWGGWGEFVRVPAGWIVPRPAGLTLEESMILGTAGFTAAQCVLALQHHEITPASGEVVVTGASGGVACLAVQMLAKLGYTVVAASGKPDKEAWLRQLGAARVIGREELLDESTRPLLSAKYAGGVDTVGGRMLATLVRSMTHRGCVAMCGVVGGADMPLTVYPFILRGVTLAGIDSAWCPEDRRAEIWQRLAGEWKPARLADVATFIGLDGISDAVQRILRGQVSGRVVIRMP
jgi:putative YhdH/YhfP family quinone oxidoreductase